MRDRAVAILGEKGAGKSTLAAALARRGHRVISDDIVALVETDQRPHVLVGQRTLKVHPEVLRSLGVDPETTLPVHPALAKRAWIAPDADVPPASPLAALVVVQPDADLKLVELPAPDLFIEAVRHTYGSRFDLMQRSGTSARHFQQVTALVRNVRGALLTRTNELSRIDDAAALVERFTG